MTIKVQRIGFDEEMFCFFHTSGIYLTISSVFLLLAEEKENWNYLIYILSTSFSVTPFTHGLVLLCVRTEKEELFALPWGAIALFE